MQFMCSHHNFSVVLSLTHPYFPRQSGKYFQHTIPNLTSHPINWVILTVAFYLKQKAKGLLDLFIFFFFFGGKQKSSARV